MNELRLFAHDVIRLRQRHKRCVTGKSYDSWSGILHVTTHINTFTRVYHS